MSSFGSHSGFDVDVDEEMNLRISFEWSKVDTQGSSESTASISRASAAQTSELHPPDIHVAQPGSAVRSVPASSRSPIVRYSVRVGMGDSARAIAPHVHSEIEAACRERHRARERDTAEQSVCYHYGMQPELDDDERKLAWVYRRSLATTGMDNCRLRRKNAKALRLAIGKLEPEAKETTEEAARIAKLKQQQDRIVPRMKGLFVLSDSSDDDTDDHNSTSSNEDQHPPSVVDAYYYGGDQKG